MVRNLRQHGLEEGISNALGARTQIVYTHFGGAALDVDNDKGLAIIEDRYDDWMAHQQNLRDGCGCYV